MFGRGRDDKRIQSLEAYIGRLEDKVAASEKRGNRWKASANIHHNFARKAVKAFDEAMQMYHDDMGGGGLWHATDGYGPLYDAWVLFKSAGLTE